jgi:hypothetical protein
MIRRCELPADSLLRPYLRDGGFADCYGTQVDHAVSHPRFVEAFYSTWLFRLERALLAIAVRRPSSDADVRALASGATERFAAWTVEGRAPGQLLLADEFGNTRSWLMARPQEGGTALYFGSAVLPRKGRTADGRPRMGGVFRALLGFHALYSRALLAAAVRRLAHLPGA